MSIIFNKDNVFLIDHMDYVNKMYKNVALSSGTKQYRITPKVFSMRCEKTKERRKRRHNDTNCISEEASTIKAKYNNLIESLPTALKTASQNVTWDSTTVRDFAKKSFEATVLDHHGISGGNSSDIPLVCQIEGRDFLVPEHCRFINGCVKSECKKLDGTKYDIVVADPPWWNKYIRRLKRTSHTLSYEMMYNEDIAAVPLASLLAESCLVAVWCTNSPSNVAAVRQLLFPRWGVELAATWFWLKLSAEHEPVCPFGAPGQKQPYERLLIGRRGAPRLPRLPPGLLFASVCSCLHSHKPPLLDLLSHHTGMREPRVLELFARYLLPGTTSVGYETLKWQHLALFEEAGGAGGACGQ